MKNLGYDAEFFLRGGRGYIPAERVLRGTKGHAAVLGPGVVGHPDNIMAEIASAGPFHHENLMERITHDFDVLRKHVAPVEVQITAGITVTEEFLAAAELAKEIGCDVDFQNGAPRDPITTESIGTSRYAGGHLHFDTSRDIPPDYCASVCDIMLAVPLIAMGERQGGRRGTYGLPGLYRPKEYGLEYRTLSNYWVSLIINNPQGNGRVFCELVGRTASAFLTMDEQILTLPQRYRDYAQEIITAEDSDEAQNLFTFIKQELN